MTSFEPLPRYPRTSERDLHRRILTEAAVLGWLMDRPPWVETRSGGEDHVVTGLRAAFAHWSPTSGSPTPEMEQTVHEVAVGDAAFDRQSEDDQDAGVARIAAVLHLVALAWRPDARSRGSVGKACAGSETSTPLLSNTRFARLMTAPPDPPLRVQALGRAFRQFKRARLAVGGGDAANLLRFLFSDTPEATVRRWVGDYYRLAATGAPVTEAPITDAEPSESTSA